MLPVYQRKKGRWMMSAHAKRMPRNDVQEPLQYLPPALNDLVGEAVSPAREREDVDARGLALEDVAEGFKVGVASADEGVSGSKAGMLIWSEEGGSGWRRHFLSRNRAEGRTLQTIS
ncbi:hypothetical protein MVEN_02573200 [Mycena venus]|uniref:Uncharacterized protein n=1 Tax=Mycena venus TaxID=2733690 RepID=A0A8H6WSE4_9AGAR|nr:hypothetical protein MVEN_02573200 [Mycena venus]